jgi:hypothetical protein
MPGCEVYETIVRGLAPRCAASASIGVVADGRSLRRKVDLRPAVVAVGPRSPASRASASSSWWPSTACRPGVVIHLGMTGRVLSRRRRPGAHTRRVRLAGGDELPRRAPVRMGRAGRFSASAALARVGPDPLTALDVPALASALTSVRGRSGVRWIGGGSRDGNHVAGRCASSTRRRPPDGCQAAPARSRRSGASTAASRDAGRRCAVRRRTVAAAKTSAGLVWAGGRAVPALRDVKRRVDAGRSTFSARRQGDAVAGLRRNRAPRRKAASGTLSPYAA